MNPHEHNFPWVFRRDEIDVLEDELEDLYETFQQGDTDATFESVILCEQLEAEEQSDQALSARLGFDVLEPPDALVCAREAHESPVDPLEEWSQDVDHVRSHPLYQAAKHWAALVKPYAKRGYEDGHECMNELFRVYANVNLVPLKIFTALCEEMHGDEVGWEVAREEYGLTITYIERILDSLNLMSFVQEFSPWIEAARTGAEALREECVRATSHLSRRKPTL